MVILRFFESDPAVLVAIAVGLAAQYVPRGAVNHLLVGFSRLRPAVQGLVLALTLVLIDAKLAALTVGMVTAFGGGSLRDLVLNRHPLFWVEHWFHTIWFDKVREFGRLLVKSGMLKAPLIVQPRTTSPIWMTHQRYRLISKTLM
jgi:hypothetical protein